MTYREKHVFRILFPAALVGAILSFSVLPSVAEAKKDFSEKKIKREIVKNLLDKDDGKLQDKIQAVVLSRARTAGGIITIAQTSDIEMETPNTPNDIEPENPASDTASELKMPNTILMPVTPIMPAMPEADKPQENPTPATQQETQKPENHENPPSARNTSNTTQARNTSEQTLAMSFPIRETAGNVLEQAATDLPDIPSQPIINTLSQASNFSDYYNWSKLSPKTTNNLFGLAALLAAAGLFMVSGLINSPRKKENKEADYRSASVSY